MDGGHEMVLLDTHELFSLRDNITSQQDDYFMRRAMLTIGKLEVGERSMY
jgi:hypothetical protein